MSKYLQITTKPWDGSSNSFLNDEIESAPHNSLKREQEPCVTFLNLDVFSLLPIFQSIHIIQGPYT